MRTRHIKIHYQVCVCMFQLSKSEAHPDIPGPAVSDLLYTPMIWTNYHTFPPVTAVFKKRKKNWKSLQSLDICLLNNLGAGEYTTWHRDSTGSLGNNGLVKTVRLLRQRQRKTVLEGIHCAAFPPEISPRETVVTGP